MKHRPAPAPSRLPLEEALRLVVEAATAARRRGSVALGEADGLRLAAPVRADGDLPAFHRATLDGYAVNASDGAVRRGDPLTVVETVTAGSVPSSVVPPGAATLVMTGAPVPEGADAVVRREDAVLRRRGREVVLPPPRSGDGVHRRAADAARGDIVLEAGTVLSPRVVAVLASVGRVRPVVWRRPRVAVGVTGDELVAADLRTPPPAKLRNSNGPALEALVRAEGAVVRSLGAVADRVGDLERFVRRGLRGADVLILSGGVSAGDLDLVPPALRRCGVAEVFHGLDLRPGKPAWFGLREGTMVFGLPGNPVSTQVVFALLVAPALRALAGDPAPGPRVVTASLSAAMGPGGKRTAWLPARTTPSAGGLRVAPVRWNGSGDFVAFAAANALLHRPAGAPAARRGARVTVLPLDAPQGS